MTSIEAPLQIVYTTWRTKYMQVYLGETKSNPIWM